MKKTGLVCILIFIFQTGFAAFPKSLPADSLQTSLPSVQPAISLFDKLNNKEYKHLLTDLSFTQKLALKFLRHLPAKRNFIPHKSDWLASVGGFLLGFLLGPIGFGITRLTNNEPLRKGATVGFQVFLIVLAIYAALVLALLLLFASLGLL